MANFPLRRSLRRAERDVVDAAEVDLVDHLDEHARRRLVLREDQHAAVGVHGAQALDVRAHGAHVDGAVVDPDLAVVEDLDLDALRVVLVWRLSRTTSAD